MLLYVRRDTILSGLGVSSFMGSTGELIPHYPSVPSLYTASCVDSRGWYRLFASSPRAPLFNPSPHLNPAPSRSARLRRARHRPRPAKSSDNQGKSLTSVILRPEPHRLAQALPGSSKSRSAKNPHDSVSLRRPSATRPGEKCASRAHPSPSGDRALADRSPPHCAGLGRAP
jgi:hypothetical protein